MKQKRYVVILLSVAFLVLGIYFLYKGLHRGPSSEQAPQGVGETDRSSHEERAHEGHTHSEGNSAQSHENRENGGGSPQNKMRPDETKLTESLGLHNTGARERFISIPIDLEGDVVEYQEAFRSVRAALSRVKAGKMDISELSAMIEAFEFNSDWMAHLRIYAKKELGMPLSDLEGRYYPAASKRLRKELTVHWKEHNLSDEWSRRLEPILHTIRWAQNEAPVEHKLLSERYYEQCWELADKVDTFEGYLNVDERTESLYGFLL